MEQESTASIYINNNEKVNILEERPIVTAQKDTIPSTKLINKYARTIWSTL